MGRAGAVRLREGEVAAQDVVPRLLGTVVQKWRHSATQHIILLKLCVIIIRLQIQSADSIVE